MRTISRLLTLALVAAAFLALASPAWAVESYNVTDLSTLPSGGIRPNAFNESGQIVGQDPATFRPILHSNGQTTNLPGNPNAVNDLGRVVGGGLTSPGKSEAYLWDNGQVTNLGTLPNGSHSEAHDVDSSGRVVGYSGNGGVTNQGFSVDRAVLWQDGRVQDLGTLGGQYSYAEATNDVGQIAGRAEVGERQYHAFLWENGRMTDLGTLPGPGWTSSFAYDLNDKGQVVGKSALSVPNGVDTHAFMWENGQMKDLGVLSGSVRSAATAINSAGQVVGNSYDPSRGGRAVIWENGQARDLNGLLPPGSGWDLYEAIDINDKGQILAFGYKDGQCCVNSQYKGVLLTPVSDATAPTVSLTAPANGATVKGSSVTLSANASDNVGVSKVEFLVNGQVVAADTTAPYSIGWNSTSIPDGSAQIEARAHDAAGNKTTSASRTVTVANTADTTAPSVSLTAPADGAVVGGTAVTLSADASDDKGVTKVQFLVDGALVATDTTAPYSASWDSKTVRDGRYTLTAKAFDAANNHKTSAARSVVVDNFFPDTAISGGPAEGSFTRSTGATFGLLSTDGDSFLCKLDSGPVGPCTSPKSYTGLSQGRHTFSAWAVGSAGEAIDTDQSPETRSWSVDSVKPRGTVKINGGVATTRSLRVKLSLRATDPAPASGAAQMRISNDGRRWSSWGAYTTSKVWRLKAGGSGTRTVFVQYKDRAGNVSATAKDTIRYRR